MVNLLGKSTSHFNAIAPIFSQQILSTGDLTPTKAMSVFQVNGEVDGLIPLNGGNSPVGTFMSAHNSALNWANHFNCNSTAIQEDLNWGNTVLNSFTFSNCDDSHEIKYLIALNTGHGFRNEQGMYVVLCLFRCLMRRATRFSLLDSTRSRHYTPVICQTAGSSRTLTTTSTLSTRRSDL